MSGPPIELVSIRMTQARQAARLVLRTLPLPAVLAATAVSLTIVILSKRDSVLTANLPIAAVLLGIAAGFALEDPSERTTASVPVSLLVRRGLRVTLIVPFLVAAWITLLMVADPAAMDAAFTLGFLAWVAAGLGTAALAALVVPEGVAGVAAGGTLVATLMASSFLSPRWRPLPLDPVLTGRFGLYGRPVLAVLGAGLLFVLASRDPARRRLWARTRPDRWLPAVPRPTASRHDDAVLSR